MDVRTLCLGVLTLGEATGYEIKQVFDGAFAHFHAAGFGSIYPALADLAAEGLVTVTEVEQEGRPDKKIYRITPEGLTRFTEALCRTRPRERVRSEFMIQMFFAALLPPARIEDALKIKAGEYREILADLDRREAEAEGEIPPGPRFTLEFGRAVYGAALAHVETRGPALVEALAATAARNDGDPS